MPTGTGKTITFLSAVKKLNKKSLILVHRQELMEQTYDKAVRLGFSKEEISIICADKKEKLNSLNIAMVQSLNNALSHYSPQDIELIVVDEAHHSLAQTYLRIFQHFNIPSENKYLLGFTATPLRGDGKSLGSLYKDQSFKMTLQEATQKGYICPVHGIQIQLSYQLQSVEDQGGDYNIQQLDKIVNCEEINEMVAYKCSHLMRIPCIIFCSTVDHATKIKDKLVEKGKKAEVISYLNSKAECAEIYRKLKDGDIQFILNATKLTEGFDFPAIQTVVIARPTRSPVLYKQMIGRGLRLSPNKFDCLVIEFSSNDPKMISWDQIDTDCTLQCYTEKELVDKERALSFYTSKFGSIHAVILDVRISAFSFYECKIRRLFKYRKNFIITPFDDGFMIGHLKGVVYSDKKCGGIEGKRMEIYLLHWKDRYKSFISFNQGEIWQAPNGGWTHEECINQFKFYSGHCYTDGTGVGRWYPSEEEHMSAYQKKMLPGISTNARKAEMMIEEKIIKNAIQKFWVDADFPDLEEDEDGLVKNSPVFVIDGK